MTLQAEAIREPGAGSIRPLLFGLFFASGISGLIYEVVWTRELTVILGNTVYAVSTVLTVFMGGLALGSFLGGRLVDRLADPLQVYAVLELVIGVLGYLLTSVLDQTGAVYVWIHERLAGHPLWLCAARYVFAFGLLAGPTTLMGATLPALSKFIVRSERAVGADLGRLYAWNTLGAALGCYLAGFVLIGNLGIDATVRTASALSIVVGILAWVGRRRLGGAAIKTSGPSAQASLGSGNRPLRLLVLAAFAISGFAALGYEVVWTRLLTSYLGNSVYAFCTMLTAFLIGIAGGSLLFAGVADRARRPVAALGWVEIGIGVYVLASLHVFGSHAEQLSSWIEPHPWWRATAARFAKAFALTLLPTFLMGAAFPLAGRIYVAHLRRLGRSLGELYAWNTIGAVLGSAVAGFVLMPALGLQPSLVVLLCLNLLIGLALCVAEPAAPRMRKAMILAPLAVAVVAGLVAMPPGVFDPLHAGRRSGEDLVYLKEDLLGTVTVTQKGPRRTLRIDHLDVAGTGGEFLSSHKSLGHLPMLLHPNPQTVYVLGFGGGGTAYAVSTYAEVRHIDATELSRTVVDVATMFREINHDVMSDPRLHLEVNDGRHFLLTTRRTYDVISVDLLWPQTAGSGSLYTKEFYDLCHRRLNDDGIMVEWLQPGFIPTEYLKGVLRTIGRVFPHTSLWWSRRQEHLLVVACKMPLEIDVERISRRMERPATRRDLAEVHLDDPAAFLAHFIAHDRTLAEFAAASNWLNTDDLPLLEFQLPLQLRNAGPENFMAMAEVQESVLPLLTRLSPRERERISRCESSNALLYAARIAYGEDRREDAIRKCREALAINPDNHDAKSALERLGPSPRRR